MKIFFKLTLSLVVMMFVFLPLYNANAQFISGDESCESRDLAGCIFANIESTGGEYFGDPKLNLPNFIGNIIKFTLTLLGSIFLVLILYAGFQWMTAGGNTDQTKKAAQTIRNSAIGLIIILLSYAVTITVFNVILAASSNTI